MENLKITGTTTPMVGVTETYSIIGLSGQNPLQQAILSQNPTNGVLDNQIKWSVWVLEYGYWRKTKENDKWGETITYTFFQKSLRRKGIRIKVEKNGKTDTIDIAPQKAPQPKIIHVDLLNDKFERPTKPFAYGDSIIVSVHCTNMDLRKIKVTLWEDDIKGAGHNEANTRIESAMEVVKNGRAYIKFFLTVNAKILANSKLAANDKNEGETHEYYITAEIFEKAPKRIASINANVNNPDYKPEPKLPTPAQEKGPSRMEEKGILDPAIETVHDWWETTISVLNEIRMPQFDAINSLFTINVPDEEEVKDEEHEEGECPRCEKEITLKNIEDCFGIYLRARDFRTEIVNYLNQYINQRKSTDKPIHLDTCLRKAHFFAQVGTETLGINPDWMVETDSVRYNVANCKAVFGDRAKALERAGLLDDYCSDRPQKRLLNYVYGGGNGFDNGNGNEASGDGYKFRGRGLKQLTGRDNYKNASETLKEIFPDEYIDLEANPDKVKEPKYAVLSAIAYWEKHEIWKTADTLKKSTDSNIQKIRRKVNPGLVGWKDTKKYFEKGLKVFKLSECKKDGTGNNSEENDVKLHFIGATAKEDSLSSLTKKVLKEVGEESGNYDIYITSVARTPYDQARIMYENCKADLTEQRRTYRPPGQKVIDVYVNETSKGTSKENIIKSMEDKINEIGPSTVSKHLANPEILNTFDVAYGKLTDKTTFFNEIKKRNELDDILVENNCYHIQIKQ